MVERAVQGVFPKANLSRTKVETEIYIDYQDAFQQANQGKGLVTDKLADELIGREGLIAAVDPIVRRKAAANLQRDQEFARQRGLPLRGDRIRALEIMARSGISGVLQAAKSGQVLPSIAAAILAPSFLGFEETE